MAAAKSKPNEIKLTRVYDAPVKAVWEAWTDPAKAAKWWGPRGFTITTHSKDLKPGGHWDYTMHGPDGKDWPNLAKYHEVEKYQRLVYDHGGTKDTPPMFKVTVNFSEKNGKTTMEMTMTLPNEEAMKATKKIIKDANGNSTWDRLAEYLEESDTGKTKFVINRTFHASLDQMYEMWTNPKHFQKWLPPTGMNMEIISGEMKPGSSIFYMMTGGEHMKMYGKVHYKEIQKPNLTYTQEFADEKGNLARHPMAPTWPAQMLTKVHLEQEDDEHTRVTVTWEPTGAVSREELETFSKMRSGMTQGWTGSFDKLENYLEKQ